jgi:DNA-3-methyladenine glycosylase I
MTTPPDSGTPDFPEAPRPKKVKIVRCPWPRRQNPLYVRYHDVEWGVPEHDDRALFEKLILDGAQAGLSWETILNKRENYRLAYEGFIPEKIARYDKRKINELMANEGLVRNRAKIEASVGNARAFIRMCEDEGSFDRWLWAHVDGMPVTNRWKAGDQIPAETPVSIAISKELKRLGFKFVGPTIIYAWMQAIGMVNDHLVTCYRHAEVAKLAKPRSWAKKK